MRAHHLFALALLAGFAQADLLGDTQIADINTAPTVVGSYSGAVASDGQLVFFRGVDQDDGQGSRLWATDGTPGGTEQISSEALSFHEGVFLGSGELFFLADELGVGVGLWRSDGTAAGTHRVLAPQSWNQEPYDLTHFDGAVWFLAGTAAHGTEVWKCSPATEATGLELDLSPGIGSGSAQLFAGGGHLFIAGPGQSVLWSSDGTLGSLTQVATFSLAAESSFEHLGTVGPRVIFNVDAPSADRGWWSSDGTAAGTILFDDSFNTRWAVQADTKVYYTGGCCNGDLRLHETDGTVAGTLPIDLATTVDGQAIDFDEGHAVGDDLFYGGYVGASGIELCRTSGAAGGAVRLADIFPGSGSSDPNDFVDFNGEVFFRAEDGVHGRELWVVNIATNAVQLFEDSLPGPFSGIVGSSPTLATSAGGVIYGFNSPLVGMEPVVNNGQTAELLINIAEEGLSDGSDPRDWFRYGSRLLFSAHSDSVGRELFITDGTSAGTQLVADIDPINTGVGFPPSFGSFPHHFVEFQGLVYFYAFHDALGSELWSTDGTEAGTQIAIDVVPGPLGSEPLFSRPPVVLGDELFFIADDFLGRLGLYKSDGTQAGTELIMLTDETGFVAEFVVLEVVGERVVFNANGPEGHELWTTDGVTTELLKDFTPGPDHTFFVQFAPAEDRLMFVANVLGANELHVTDGTPAGTQLVLAPASSLSGPSRLAAAGDAFYFIYDDGVTGFEPWISDGTPAGTHLLADVLPGPESSGAVLFTGAGDLVYFIADSPANFFHPQQLWKTDGTELGTELVADLESPVAGPGLANLWAPGLDGSILFTNVDENGNEWWVSDGTTAGTLPLTDIAPGAAFADARVGGLVNDRLVFRATDGVNGLEPHSVPLVASGSFAATQLGSGCTGSNGVPELRFDSGAAALGESFALALENGAPLGVAFWFFDFGYAGVPAGGACALQLALPRFLGTSPMAPTTAGLALSVPNDLALLGAQLDFQALSSELGGPFFGFGALSNVLEVILSD